MQSIPGCSSSTASMWQALTGLVFGANKEEKKRSAMLNLQKALQDVQRIEVNLEKEIMALSQRARALNREGMSARTKGEMRSLLSNAKQRRGALSVARKQRQGLQNQQCALDSCEINSMVLSSMKQTSGVLRDLGMDSKLEEIDETIMDLQEYTSKASEMSAALGEASVGAEDDDDMLRFELDLLLGEDPCSISLPLPNKNTINSMSEKNMDLQPQATSDMQTKVSVSENLSTEVEESASENKRSPDVAVAGQ